MAWEAIFRSVAVARQRAASKPFGAGEMGLLAPGDNPPPPNYLGDAFDYRGVAPLSEVAALKGQPFPIGRAIDVHKQRATVPIGLPAQLMQRHVAVVGPTGSGKTTGLIVPWIDTALRAGCAVVAADVKGDLKQQLKRFVSARGPIGVRIHAWDYRNPNGSVSWHWISDLGDDKAVDGAITALLGEEEKRAAGVDPFFKRRDYSTLRGLLKFAPKVRPPQDLTVADLLTLIKDQDVLAGLVELHPRLPGADDLDFAGRLSPSDYDRAISGAIAVLTVLNTPAFQAVTNRVSLRLEDVLSGPGLLLVGAPTDDDRLGQASAGLMLNSIMHRAYQRYTSGQPGYPLVIVADEAPRLAAHFDFERPLSIARGADVSLVLAMQDVGQFDEHKRDAVFANCGTVIALGGVHPPSAEYLAKRFGERQSQRYGMSDSGAFNPMGTSLTTETVPVLRTREIMQVPFGPHPAIVHVNAAGIPVTPRPIITDLTDNGLI